MKRNKVKIKPNTFFIKDDNVFFYIGEEQDGSGGFTIIDLTYKLLTWTPASFFDTIKIIKKNKKTLDNVKGYEKLVQEIVNDDITYHKSKVKYLQELKMGMTKVFKGV